MPAFESEAVEQVFAERKPRYRKSLMRLRALVLTTARETEGAMPAMQC